MSYDLIFLKTALKEWRKLDSKTRSIFEAKLEERLHHPRVSSAKLSGHRDRYKIKLHKVGYRLVYEVRDERLVVIVIAVGRRDGDEVYDAAAKR